MKSQLASNNAAIDAKLAKLAGTMGDMEEALRGCTDDMADMRTSTPRSLCLRTNMKTWKQNRVAIILGSLALERVLALWLWPPC